MLNKRHIENVVKGALILLPLAASAESWLYNNQFVSGGFGYEAKMPDEDKYEGGKLVVTGRYILSEEVQPVDEKRLCCDMPSKPLEYRGVLDAAVRLSADNGLEYIALGVTPWAKMWDPGVSSDKKWRARRDLLELGVARFVSDDALELDSYLELGLFRAGRVGEYRPSPESNWFINTGAQGSVGWAWAESADNAYSTVSNPYAGLYLDTAWTYGSFGSVYLQGRFVNGFSVSNPSRGHPTAREARVRSGYARFFGEQQDLKLDIYWQKRSFYFDEGGLPNLYTWVRTYGAEMLWLF